jgi:uncharacterized membrane protein
MQAREQYDGEPRLAQRLGVIGIGAGLALAAVEVARRTSAASATRTARTIRVSKTFTINRDLDAVYSAWRDRDELPDVLRYLRSIDAEVLEDIPNTRLVWRSSARTVGGRTSGSVTFRRAPGDRGTELRVDIEYTPLTGRAGHAIARLLRAAPEQQIQEDLRRLKQLLETGEIARTAGDLAGQGARS